MVDPETAVSGRCTDIDDTVVPDLQLRAYVRGPDQPDEMVGETRTGEEGRYHINVGADLAAELNRPGRFVFVRASQAGEVVGESDLTPIETGDLILDVQLRVRAEWAAVTSSPRWVRGVVRD